MAEVGVLNLTINDNSEQAGKGLDKLAGALRAVKSAMEGFDLSPVGQQVKALADSINKTQATTIKSLTGLFNAVTNFSKIKSFKIDTKPFTDLRDAIGDGFKIGIAGSQLNQLREAMTGDWGDGTAIQTLRDLSDIAQTFGGGGEGIGSITNAVKGTASAMKELNKSAAAAGDWRTMMAEMSSQSQKGDRIVPFNLQFFGKKSGLGPKGEETLAQAEAMMEQINKPFEQLEENIESVSQPIESTIQEIEGNMQSFASQVQTASEETVEAMNRMFYSQMNITDFIDKPLDYMRDIYRTSTESLKGYESGINAALPSIQKLSSEEMIIAGNAKQAKAAIDGLLSRLNAPIKTKGLSDMINWSMNIGKQPLSAESSADAFANMSNKAAAVEEVRNKAESAAAAQADFNTQIQSMDLSGYGSIAELFDNIEGKIRYVVTTTKEVFDTMKDAQARVDGLETAAKQAEASVINLSTIPATGLNGDFASAAEELQYLTDKINEAKANMEFWGETYDKTQKRIKYNGGTEELYNMLTHAEEGFYAAGESAEQYQAALIQTQDAISAYIANTQQVIESTQAEVAAVNEAANAVAQLDNAMQQSTIAQKAAENSAAIEELFNTLNNPPQAKLSDVVNGLLGINDAAKSAQDSMAVFMDAMAFSDAPIADTVRNLNPELSELSSEMSGVTNTINGATIPALVDLDGELKQKKSDAAGAAGAFGKLGAGLKAMFPTLSGLIARFKSMAVMRTMRYMIREISKGLSEGIQNVYHYSDAVGTSFAPAMDSAATVLAQFKNSIGAAVAPLIQSLIPALNAVVNVVITAINWLNQFFALLGGQTTWTKALPVTTKAFDDQKKAAKGAGGAMKDLLADWDELNIIQSQGGGGGTGTGKTAEDYKSMFEQVTKFEGWIKDLVDGITEQFGSIWNLAKKVGLAILGWKMSKALTGLIGTLGGLVGTTIVFDLVFELTSMFDKNWLKTGEAGWLIASALTPLIGGFFAKKILGNVLGGKFTKLAIPVSLLISAVADLIANVGDTDVSALSKESLGLSATSALKVGGAAAYLAKTLMGHSLGASIAGGSAIAIATFGVAVGIKAVARAIKGEDTVETIKGLALSSLMVGIGAGWFAKLAGASLLGAASFGAAAAGFTVLTLTAAIGIAALLTLSKENPVKWGNKTLTEQQVQAYVTANGFTLNVPSTIKIIKEKIDTSGIKKSELESQLTTALGDFEVIKLGIANKDDYAQLKKDILGDDESGTSGLVDKIEEYIQSAKDMGKLTIQFTPELVGDNKTDGANWLSTYTKGWGEVDKFATETGNRIGTLLTKAENDALKEGEADLLATLMEQLSNLTSSITSAKISSEAFAALQLNLGDITQKDFDKIVEAFKNYKDQLKQQYEALVNEEYVKQGELVAALLNIDPNQKKQITKDAIAAYEAMGANLVNAANTAAEKAAEPGAKRLLTFLIDKYKPIMDKMQDLWGDYQGEGVFASYFDDMFTLDGLGVEDAISQLKILMMNQLFSFDEDLGNYVEALELNPFALIADNKEMRSAIEDYVKNMFGPETAEEILKGIFPVAEEVAEKAKEAAKEIENSVPETTAATTLAETTSDVEDVKNNIEQQQENVTNLADTVEEQGARISGTDLNIDTAGIASSTNAAASAVEDMASRIRAAFASLDGLSYSMDVQGETYTGAMKVLVPVQKRAMGGPVRSGDLVMTNENGNFEMMGRMGNQPVVANNQQIVNGISQGVETANGGVVQGLNELSGLMRQLLQKEVVAKVVPSSTMGRSNQMSADAYDRVRG